LLRRYWCRYHKTWVGFVSRRHPPPLVLWWRKWGFPVVVVVGRKTVWNGRIMAGSLHKPSKKREEGRVREGTSGQSSTRELPRPLSRRIHVGSTKRLSFCV
jgi:hypothetical protein